MGAEDPNSLVAVEFEVFGQVQGCFFTKYCKDLAESLGLTGWVKNTKRSTIYGKLQGQKAHIDVIKINLNITSCGGKISMATAILGKQIIDNAFSMLNWLSTEGSPGCKIEKCDLTNWQYLSRLDYHNFSIRF